MKKITLIISIVAIALLISGVSAVMLNNDNSDEVTSTDTPKEQYLQDKNGSPEQEKKQNQLSESKNTGLNRVEVTTAGISKEQYLIERFGTADEGKKPYNTFEEYLDYINQFPPQEGESVYEIIVPDNIGRW